MDDLHEARQRYADAASEHADACAAYAKTYTALQEARAEHKPVKAIELQSQLALALARRELAQQMLEGHRAKLKAVEKRALQALLTEQVKTYQTMCDAVALQLAVLVELDTRLGNVVPQCAGLGRFTAPAFGSMVADDTGAYRTYIHVAGMQPQAATLVDQLLSKEEHEADMATA
jgi:hypothetical protein